MSVEPFEVRIPQAALDDLRERLAATRWTDEVAGAGWDYGANLAYVKELCEYWQDGFDWRAQEEKINRFDHFRAEVDGFGIHFIHERGKRDDSTPLLLLHGWPSSFLQMLDIIPMLTDPEGHGGDAADSFDVVVPSLPGFGFSDRPSEPGWGAYRISELFTKLMTEELGYGRFGARASDLGAGVTKEIALAHPDLLIGLHHSGTSFFVYAAPPDMTEAEQAFVAEAQGFQMAEGAYAALQSTKPETVAVGLNDSPAGLAAWIVEKFRAWSDCGGNVEKRFSKDELLTNLTIYWATETINSSMRFYYESAHVYSPNAGKRVEVPTGMAMLPADIVHGPREWQEREYDVRRFTELPRGGHFAEWEEPALIAEDVRAFFRSLKESATGAARHTA
jgi:pimeloyl-ACP methyl ester carboxylesterase